MAKYKGTGIVTMFDAQNTKENKPMTAKQKETNRKKSSIRSRVEHVFGFEEGSMNRLTTRKIGLLRAKCSIFMTNLIYNFCRFEQISRLGIN